MLYAAIDWNMYDLLYTLDIQWKSLKDSDFDYRYNNTKNIFEFDIQIIATTIFKRVV